jgi:hypothetical protein
MSENAHEKIQVTYLPGLKEVVFVYHIHHSDPYHPHIFATYANPNQSLWKTEYEIWTGSESATMWLMDLSR